MAILKKIYRKDYTGEDIVTQAVYENSAWSYSKETAGTSFAFTPKSDTALVIGNGLGQRIIDLKLLKKDRGFQGSKTLRLYGCNALYRDFDPDFLIVTRDDIANEIVTANLKSGDYCKSHIVYASVKNILNYPGNFHVIPQSPGWNSGAIAAYLACFDGHKKVYLLGHDTLDTAGADYNVYSGSNGYVGKNTASALLYENSMLQVFQTYSDVDFVLVNKTGKGTIPESWKYCLNLRRLNLRQFVLEADI